MAMRRKPRDPMLLGMPSPGLARIKRMNMADLNKRIETLQTECARLSTKIDKLMKQDPPQQQKIKSHKDQIARLEALEKAAREQLEVKEQRKQRWEERHR